MIVPRNMDFYKVNDMNDDQEDKLDEILDECDNVFYENESKIEEILKGYAATIEL